MKKILALLTLSLLLSPLGVSAKKSSPKKMMALVKKQIRQRKLSTMPLDKRIELAEKRLAKLEQKMAKTDNAQLKDKIGKAIERRKAKLENWKKMLEQAPKTPLVQVDEAEITTIIPEEETTTDDEALEIPEVLESEAEEVLPEEEIPADMVMEYASADMNDMEEYQADMNTIE